MFNWEIFWNVILLFIGLMAFIGTVGTIGFLLFTGRELWALFLTTVIAFLIAVIGGYVG